MKITPHPLIELPAESDLIFLEKNKGRVAVYDLLQAREKRIQVSIEDPLNYGFDLEHWKHADDFLENEEFVAIFGGNRSGKTRFGARTVVKALLANPGTEIICFAQDTSASIRVQQRAVYDYLPPKFKKKTKSSLEYLNWSKKNGFTGAEFILPNGSVCYFQTYSQFQHSTAKFEGIELGCVSPEWHNVGLWLDEYLGDGSLIETMKFRLVTRNAKTIMTFTPIDGHTPFVGEFLKDAETKKEAYGELVDEMLPLVQYSHYKQAGVVFFHSILNPFGGYSRLKKELKNATREDILTRAYGIPIKSINTLWPTFNTGVHVIDKLPAINKKSHTIIMVLDPAGNRNYAAIWAAIDRKKNVTIIREWPDREKYGEWAEMGKRWKQGPASRKIGYDVAGYIKLFKEIEQDMGIEVYERIGDCRYFARENENNIDLFDQFASLGMHFLPSNGVDIQTGITSLDEWMSYNPNLPVDAANKPILQIHKSCGNLIHGVLNWGHKGKEDEALKDFPDLLRYLRTHNDGYGPMFISEEMLKTTKQGTGGY